MYFTLPIFFQARQKSGVSKRAQERSGLADGNRVREEHQRRIEDERLEESGRERSEEPGLRMSPRRVNTRRFAFASTENRCRFFGKLTRHIDIDPFYSH